MWMHPASCAVTRLELFFHDVQLPHATGFIYAFGKDVGLVSNWHAFAGRHPHTNLIFDSRGYTPNRVKFHITNATVLERGVNYHFLEMDLPLVSHDGAAWWQHPGYIDNENEPQQVDLGILPLNGHFESFEGMRKTIQCFETQVILSASRDSKDQTYQQGTARVGSEVFILGYPVGLASQGVFPIWKRGSIASEPLFSLEGNLPVFLTDALTRDGMSGSPVIYLGPEIVAEDGRIAIHDRSHLDDPWLLGVYAGRRGSSRDELDMAVGRVWKAHLLQEIFHHQIRGGTPPQAITNGDVD